MVISGKRLLFWVVSVLLLLMVPLVAMQLTTEVNWDIMDFAVMGGALILVGLVYELIVRKSQKRNYRVAFALALAAVFLLFWVNAAVGIIGNEGQTANLLYLAVIAIVLLGSFLVRFKSRGMAITMLIAAIVQILVPVLALLFWPPSTISWSPSILGVFMLSSFFALLFFVSAVFFRRSI